MAVTQQQLALQMLAQLRVLDPSVSAEVGTPERKILDTVAQALSDSQVDLTQLSGALDVDSKYGQNLDRFLALFGFGRQQAVRAQGFVDFRRDGASTIDIRIPMGSQIQLPADDDVDLFDTTLPVYETTFESTLLAGQTSVSVPVRAIIAGESGNLEAGKFLQPVGAPVYGITEWYNVAAITGGIDQEDDDQLKTRFKNTVFRNLAGTQDQFMALAVSTAYTTKVNVVGPISGTENISKSLPPMIRRILVTVLSRESGPQLCLPSRTQSISMTLCQISFPTGKRVLGRCSIETALIGV
jgi:uncharacterized phage protein gp47/JayE